MHGLVSLLDKEHYAHVENIWQMLEDECGLAGIKVTPFPHFSWLIARDFDWKALEETLKEIAKKTRPFTINTGGIGLFSGPSPVIFIPIIRTKALNKLHQHIWDAIQPLGEDISPYYAPQSWVPHITLAQIDVSKENIACVMERLAFQTFTWEIQVNSIRFIHQTSREAGELFYQYQFQGE
ncbi:MAG: 2'-5' RNA ligase family protein [Anaerolineae bacterium]|jgi:2'-5' RNA ligase|nr:2'-5' RNA ligase family protein [Anaerolineae bacterium]MBT7070623.1 2'-5' RNA ligase family protein [Anaerolineae bacterium]MBT7326251.1 2'-5' RNA ligase family protein [Anaerolineae bacterium]MBT7602615.1 2'-5' RNA ligase family protein [Anaerolineae bacterium]